MTTKLFDVHVSDVLLATAKATHSLPKVKTAKVIRPQRVAPVKAAVIKIHSPESSILAPEETIAFDGMIDSNTPDLTTDASISSPIIAEVLSDKACAVSCDTEPGDQHDDTWEPQSSITMSDSGGSGNTSPSTPDLGHFDVISNDAQTSQDSDTHMHSYEEGNQAKMLACSVGHHNAVLPISAGPCGLNASVDAISGAPVQGDSTSLCSAPPSSQLSHEPITSDTRSDNVCTPDKTTEASSSIKVITPVEVSQSPIQGDQSLDVISELDTSELDIRCASESDFSPKSSASSTASSVASASSVSAPYEQSVSTSEMDSIAHSQPLTPTDEVASAKVDFRSLNCSIRPQYRVEYPRSTQITCINMNMTEWYTHRPTAEADAAEWVSQAWTHDNILDFDGKKGRYGNLEKDEYDRSTECDEDLGNLQGRANYSALGSGDPHGDVHDTVHYKVPESLSKPSMIAHTSLRPATTCDRVAAAFPPEYFCMTISMNNNNNKASDTGQSMFMPDQYGAAQAYNGNTYPRAISQDKEDRRVHTYRHNLSTITALVVEERNVTKSEPNHSTSDPEVPIEHSTDSEPDVIDIDFIPQAVRQHAESQKKSRQAANQGSSQRGKKPKNSKKKTGRLNKERACIEKVLQPTNEEAIDQPETSENPTGKVTDSRLPKDGYEQDLTSKTASKKKQKRRLRRQQMSQDAQIEQPVAPTCTSIDEQMRTSGGANSDETSGLQGIDTESPAQDGIKADAMEPSPVQTEQHETTSTRSDLATTVHDTTTDGDTRGVECHTVAAHEVWGEPSPLRKQTLTPILEEVEPESDSPINDAGDGSCHMATRLVGPEPAALASAGDTMSTHMQLTRFVQQEPPQEGVIEYCTDLTAYHEYPHPPQAYNEGTWPNYGPAPLTNYHYHHMEPAISYQYPFSHQLPEDQTPYYDYEPYASSEQTQYFEAFYDQYYRFCHQVPLSRYEPFGYATPRLLQVSWQEWQPYAERYTGQPFGIRTHRKEQKDKPWHLQTLGYEEELEEEFETGDPTQRERTRRSCRKYGL